MRANIINYIFRVTVLLVAVTPFPAFSETAVNGIVSDVISQQRIVEAQVDVIRNGSTIGTSFSKFGGGYLTSFPVSDVDRNASITLKVSHKDYLSATFPVQINNGQPVNTTYPISLVPADIIDCSDESEHTIIIGRFRQPADQQINDLPERIRDALHYNLNHRLQTVESLGVKPNFEYCSAAKEKWSDYGKELAQFLKAHAYIYGDVSKSEDVHYKVRAFVTDAYDLFAQPYLVENNDVNLAQAASAIMNVETYVALLGSLAAGLAANGDCASAITVVNVAQTELGEVSEFAFLSNIKRKCMSELPHNDLLSGGN